MILNPHIEDIIRDNVFALSKFRLKKEIVKNLYHLFQTRQKTISIHPSINLRCNPQSHLLSLPITLPPPSIVLVCHIGVDSDGELRASLPIRDRKWHPPPHHRHHRFGYGRRRTSFLVLRLWRNDQLFCRQRQTWKHSEGKTSTSEFP